MESPFRNLVKLLSMSDGHTTPQEITDALGPGWQGTCCFCLGKMTPEDFLQEKAVIAAVGGGLACLHLEHLTNKLTHAAATHALAEEAAAQIRSLVKRARDRPNGKNLNS